MEQKQVITLVIAIIVGIIIGLVVGWMLWHGAAPADTCPVPV